jgi:hypothetical protein
MDCIYYGESLEKNNNPKKLRRFQRKSMTKNKETVHEQIFFEDNKNPNAINKLYIINFNFKSLMFFM